MSRMRIALREAGTLFVAATALGLIYTAATEKGIFNAQNTASAPVIVSQDQARAFFDSGRALFVDSRHAYDYKLGHIKGAINLPLNEYDSRKTILAQLPKDKLIVVYCDGADCNSSIELSAKLFLDGFTNAKILFGGWSEWRNMDFPIEKSIQ